MFKSFLKKIFKRSNKKATSAETGFLVFANTGEVIRAESILKAAGVSVSVMGPPPALRSGCDMVVCFPLIHQLSVMRILKKEALLPIQVVPANENLLSPVSLFAQKDYGDYLMVRAANMKITVEKGARRIVNISGGGCPDVPYLAALLVGKTLQDAPNPAEYGQTLCGYALHLAFQEIDRQLCG